ncbi:MAG: metallophosphoesterase [Clostridiales bacterium]|nr:metallophosphoesterase [Clostridiales bacterium]
MKIDSTEYRIESAALPAAFDGFTVAHVSDLHNHDFKGELLSRIQKIAPNVIAITGDMIHKEGRTAASVAFAREAVQIAPTYYVSGNHEKVLSCFKDFRQTLIDTGVRVLENEFCLIEREGARLAIAGMNDPVFFPHGKSDFYAELNALKIRTEEAGADYMILLSHRPELFKTYVAVGVDLTLVGHAHGGQVRFPLIGALYAPNQGLFPRLVKGMHQKDGKAMVISRGLGSSSWAPRVLNPPELCIERLRAL